MLIPKLGYKKRVELGLKVYLRILQMNWINYRKKKNILSKIKFPVLSIKMKTQTNNFYIMGCWEFESVCQQSKNKQQGLLFSIQDLIANKIKIYQIDHLDRIYQDFFSSIMKDTSSI